MKTHRLALLVLVFLAGAPAVPARADDPLLLLVSMDGFRWSYLGQHPAETPHLHKLIAEGVSARELIPVYPSNTFPNHYTIVTGLYPAHHGIVNNHFFDPKLGEFFHYTVASDNRDPRWWGGEPIWVTAVRQGRKSAAYYWVGAEAAVGGVTPTYLVPFNAAIYKTQPFSQRIDRVIGWLKQPPALRPAIITFYIEETNSVGHAAGPQSPQLAEALRLVDGRLGALLDRLEAEHIPVNVIVVSDHGMTDVSMERVIYLDDYLDPKKVQVDFQGPEAGLRPLEGTPADLLRSLAGLVHAHAWLTDDGGGPTGPDLLPARFHLAGTPRLPPVWITADEGWHVGTRAYFRAPANRDQKGDHGYDNAYRSMHGILIAHGPSFKSDGEIIGPVENIHIYNLLCAALHLQPAPNDGDDRLVKAMLR